MHISKIIFVLLSFMANYICNFFYSTRISWIAVNRKFDKGHNFGIFNSTGKFDLLFLFCYFSFLLFFSSIIFTKNKPKLARSKITIFFVIRRKIFGEILKIIFCLGEFLNIFVGFQNPWLRFLDFFDNFRRFRNVFRFPLYFHNYFLF